MKTKSILSYFLAMIVASGMFSCSSSNNDGDFTPPFNPSPTAPVAYTIMLYSTGGENLDISTESDFKKICEGLQKVSNVRAFLQYKYSTQAGMNTQATNYYNNNNVEYEWLGEAGALYRLEFKGSMIAENGGMYVFTPEMKWGTQQKNAEMFQPDSIASFIKYCQRVAPAQNYILVIGDHGSGYRVEYDYQKTRAVCSDDFFEGSPDISCSELRQGIEKSGVHLRLLNFDDCLMNNLDALSEFTDVTDYVMASSHITNGGDFTKFIEFLSVAGSNGDFVGEMSKYTDTFISEYNSMEETTEVTKWLPGTKKHSNFVFTDMKKYKAILPAMKAFTDKLLSEADAGTLTATMMADAAKGCYQSTVDYPHYDIMQYATLLKNGDSNLDAVYNQLKAAIDAAQIKHVYTDVVKDYLNLSTTPYNKLSYNINLGATVNVGATTATILRHAGFDTTTATVKCVDENGKTVYFAPDAGTFNYDSSGSQNLKWAWTNSYLLTSFNQQVGWDRWIRKNSCFPTGNPPFYFK